MHPSTVQYLTNREIAEEYDEFFAGNPLFDFDTRTLTRWFAVPGRVLDIGSGTARHVIPLAKMGHRVVGADLSAHMLRVAVTKLAQSGVKASLIRADMVDLPRLFRPDSLDYALCMFSTIGLIRGGKNRLSFLKGLAQLLRPGGRFAVHVHNRWHGLGSLDGSTFILSNLWKTWRGQAELGDKILWYYRGVRDMYVHLFSQSELTDLLIGAGFVIREMIPLNRRRSGPLRIPLAHNLRANGFIALAERPA